MPPFSPLLLDAIRALLVLLGLTLLFGQMLRYVRRWTGWRRDLATGAGFGLIAAGAMLVSVDLGGGILADLRNAAVAGSALFGGPLATLVAAVIAAACRMAIAPNALGALLGIAGAALIGIVVRLAYVARGRPVGWAQVVGFAVALALINAATPLLAAALGLLPWARAAGLGTVFLWAGLALNPLGLLILWGFLRLELTRLDGERALQQSNLAYEAAVGERDLANAALRDTQARFEAIMQHTPLIVAVKDLDGRYTFVNPAFERHFGVAARDILGRTSHAMTEPEHAEVYAAQDRQVIATREPLQQELTAPAASGLRTTLSVKFPLIDDKDAVQAVGMIVADVTDQRRVDAQLAHAQRLQAVGQLTGGVAHDFNNLLTVVLGNAGVLADEPHADPARRQRLAEMIASAAERGAELTKRLLAFSRRQALKPEAVEANRLIRDMEGLLRRTLGEHIEIETAFAGDLWRAHADPVQVESAILNLAINARDAMLGGGKLLIETRNAGFGAEAAILEQELRPGDYVMIAVSDTGSGMPPEVAARAFEPFFTTKPVGQGSGLGLSMVYGFAKQSGGHVKIYSEVGHGTSVKLYLPRAPQDAGDAAAAGAAPAQAEPRGHETILVVEDDPLVRSTVIGQLRGLGYQVVETGSGSAALGVLGQGAAVDLMFTDVVMPGGLDGKELARRARAVRPGLKVLFTTGYTEDAAIRHGRLEAGVRLLNKPYRRADLARAIRQALEE